MPQWMRYPDIYWLVWVKLKIKKTTLVVVIPMMQQRASILLDAAPQSIVKPSCTLMGQQKKTVINSWGVCSPYMSTDTPPNTHTPVSMCTEEERTCLQKHQCMHTHTHTHTHTPHHCVKSDKTNRHRQLFLLQYPFIVLITQIFTKTEDFLQQDQRKRVPPSELQIWRRLVLF